MTQSEPQLLELVIRVLEEVKVEAMAVEEANEAPEVGRK